MIYILTILSLDLAATEQEMVENYDNFWLQLVGDRMVGKSSIIRRFLVDNFNSNYNPTRGKHVHTIYIQKCTFEGVCGR